MKTKKLFANFCFFALIAFTAVGCNDKDKGVDDPFGGGTQPPTGGSTIESTTIPKLLEKITTTETAIGNYKLTAVVTTNVAGKNFPKGTLSIQTQGATTEGNGIIVFKYGSSFVNDYEQGDIIEIDLSKAKKQAYKKSDATGTALCNEIIITDTTCIKKTGQKATLTPITITPDKLEAFQGMYVQIENSKAVTAPTTWPKETTKFTSDSKEFPVYVSEFATSIVGRAFNDTAATIKGLATVHGGTGTAQLTPCNANDVDFFIIKGVPSIVPKNTFVDFIKTGGSYTVTITSNSEGYTLFAKAQNGNFTYSFNTEKTAIEIVAATNNTGADITDIITLYYAETEGGEAKASAEIQVKQYGKETPYESNVTLPTSSALNGAISGSTSAYILSCTVNGGVAKYPCIKLGINNAGGSCEFTPGVAGTKLKFYAVTWNKKSSDIKITSSTSGVTITPETISPTANTSASGNPPYKLTLDDGKDYFTATLTNFTATSKLKIESTSERVIILGIKIE